MLLMKKELFITHIKKNGVIIIHRDDPNLNMRILNEFRQLKGFIQYIDFDCQINPKGGCKETPVSLQCCCHACYDSAGYFRRMIDTDITKYARHFNGKTGFWRKGKGCILHHRMRSVTCLTHHCNNSYDRHNYKKEDFRIGISTIKYELQALRKKI